MDTIVNSPSGEHFVLHESPCKVRISITVTPLGNVLQETAKKSQARNIQHIRAAKYRIIAHIFSLYLQTGACALRRYSENVLEQSPKKSPIVASSLGMQFSSMPGSPPPEHRKATHPCSFEVRCGHVPCVGQCNVGGGDTSHFSGEATLLPAFAAVPSSGLRAADPQPTCGRPTVRVMLSLSHPFSDCQLLDHDLACHN